MNFHAFRVADELRQDAGWQFEQRCLDFPAVKSDDPFHAGEYSIFEINWNGWRPRHTWIHVCHVVRMSLSYYHCHHNNASFRGEHLKALARLRRPRQPVVYEVRLEVDTAVLADFDDWLLLHVREMLALPGFQAASVYRGETLTEGNRAVRLVAYEVRGHRELKSYMHTYAAVMRQQGIARFGEQFAATRRTLTAAEYVVPEGVSLLFDRQAISGGLPVCGNCLEPVAGRFCANCGQEDRPVMLSLGELLYDFIGDLFNFDSRLFRTLRPLLFRPGWLTAEFMRGRRQQYLPPVRMYIFISIVFFFLAATLTDLRFGDNINADLADGPVNVEGMENLTPEQRAEVAARMREAEQNLGLPEGTLSLPGETTAEEGAENPPADDVTTEDAPAANPATEGGVDAEPTEDEDDFDNMRLNTGPGSIVFKDGEVEASGFGSPDIDERLERGARALKRDPKQFARMVLQQIPSAMFFFLPLIALVLKLLYVGSGRYYVEHLIFTLHYHSAAFVLLLAWLLFGELIVLWPLLDPLSGWLTLALWLYLPYYLYRSLRRVYGQGRTVTVLKFTLLLLAYFISVIAMFVFTLLFTLYQQG